jgi:hypothetical protein
MDHAHSASDNLTGLPRFPHFTDLALVLTLVTGASDLRIPCCASKRTQPISGMPNSVPGMPGLGETASRYLHACFANLSRDVRDLRVRAGASFGFDPVLVAWKPDKHNTSWSLV